MSGLLVGTIVSFLLMALFVISYTIESDEIFGVSILIMTIFIVISFCIIDDISPQPIKEACAENHISFTFVETVAEFTGESQSDVYTVIKYCSKNEYDTYDTIKLIDNELSDEEVAAIVAASDLREKQKENNE